MIAVIVLAIFMLSPAYAGDAKPFTGHDPALVVMEQEFNTLEAKHGFDSPQVAAVCPRLFGAWLLRAENQWALDLTDRVLALMDAEQRAGVAVDDSTLAQIGQMRGMVRRQLDACMTKVPHVARDAGRTMRIVPQGTSGRPLNFDPKVSHDGAYLLDISQSYIIVREIGSGVVVHRFPAGQRQIQQAAWAGDGRVVVHTDRCISLWDIEAEKNLATVAAPVVGQLVGVLGTPDGQRVITVYGAVEGMQHGSYSLVWRVTPTGLVREYFLDGSWPRVFTLLPQYSVFLSRDGNMLNVVDSLGWHAWPVGADEEMRGGTKVEWLNRNLLKVAGAEDSELMKGIAISPDSDVLAITTSGVDQPNRLHIVSLQGGTNPVIELGKNVFPLIPRFSPDGRFILVGNDEVRRFGTGEKVAFQGSCTDTDWMPDGRLLCVSFSDMTLVDLDRGDVDYTGSTVSNVTRSGDIRFSPDGNALFVGGGGLVKWDIESLYPDPYLMGGGHESLAFNDGYLLSAFGGDINRYGWKKWGVAGSTDHLNGSEGWAGEARNQMDTGQINEFGYSEIRLTPDGRYMVTADGNGTLQVTESGSGKFLREFQVRDTTVTAIAISPDSQFIASSHDYGWMDKRNGQIYIWRLKDASRVKKMVNDDQSSISALKYIGDGSRLVSVSFAGVTAWDVEQGVSVPYLDKRYEWAGAFEVSPDRNTLYIGHVASTGPRITAIDFKTGHEKRSWIAQDRVKAIDVAPNGQLLAASLEDGTVQLWNTKRKNATVQLARGYMDWVVYTPEGYYSSSRSGTRLVAGVLDGKPIGLDQLALRYNRPDIILERMGLGTPDMIDHYRLRYASRLRKAGVPEGIKPDVSALPQVFLGNIRQDGNHAEVSFRMTSSGSALAGYRLQINGVPVIQKDHIEKGMHEFKGEVRVDLVYGKNLVELVAVNDQGLESVGVRKLLVSDVAVKGDLYFIGFGVSQYRNPDLNLKYADKDALDLEKMFNVSDQFAEVYTTSFVNEQVTSNAMSEARKILLNSKVDDTVIIFIAGHGMYDRDGKAAYYYLSYEADPDKLSSTAIPFTKIESMVAGIPARRKLLLIDTCESGELDTATVTARFEGASERGINPRTVRGLQLKAVEKGGYKPRRYLTQRDRYLYNALSQRTGAVIFASALGQEFAYEDDEVKNGFFTEAIIKTLTSTFSFSVRPGEAGTRFSQFSGKVKEEVVKLSEGKQNPTVDRSNIHAGIKIDPIPDFLMQSFE